jgi:hypothetical protein
MQTKYHSLFTNLILIISYISENIKGGPLDISQFFIVEVITFMSAFKNKSISLYDKNYSDLRKKIVDNTKLQS